MILDWELFYAWLRAWGIWITLGSFVGFLVGIWFASWLVLRLPRDHFVTHETIPFFARHPVVYLVLLVVRNGVGGTLMLLGIVLLLLPGQGILTVILGLSLMKFPGKTRLVDWIVAHKPIQRSLNWIRLKGHREPLEFPTLKRRQATVNDDENPAVPPDSGAQGTGS